MPYKTREAHNKAARDRYAKNAAGREKQLARVKRTNAAARVAVRGLIADFKAAGCSECGEKEALCLSAHHLDPAQKSFDVGNAVQLRFGVQRLKDELKKCVCLCHNCHAKVHAGIIKLGGK